MLIYSLNNANCLSDAKFILSLKIFFFFNIIAKNIESVMVSEK